MTLNLLKGISILLAALAGGMFWGPWRALTYAIRTVEPVGFLVLDHRLSRNMAAVMTLLPAALLAMGPVLWLT